MQPTPEQQRVIDEQGNCVILAGPGSGKTFTLACKIQTILPTLMSHRGIIAISYTNKASDELQRRSLAGGVDKKNSFFGTIDKFFLTEIVLSFGTHIFGLSRQGVKVIGQKDVEQLEDVNFTYTSYERIVTRTLPILTQLYQNGQVILESFGFLALYIYNNSVACRRYLKARYSHIIIDEYQDCGDWQHAVFMSLVNLGLCGVAVGDPNQSIFAFAKKDSIYLTNLARQNDTFTLYSIEKNHRCHPSIVNYSLRLLSRNSVMLPADEIRVYKKHIRGSEIEIAQWLSSVIPRIAERRQITPLNQIAILVKDYRTADFIHEHLNLPHKYFKELLLDKDPSLWGTIFRKILIWFFNPKITKHEFIEEYLNDYQRPQIQKVMKLLREIETTAQHDFTQLVNCLNHFTFIADLIYPAAYNSDAIDKLLLVLSNEENLSSYIPATPNEIQLMTLHKSKGLEFELVFHLNLYAWTFPQKYDNQYSQYEQDLHLHYVGITRAKSYCVFCTSSHRHNKKGKIEAKESEFLFLYDLKTLRCDL